MIVDFDAGRILGATKALTTKEDLSVGILNAIDALPSEHLTKAEIISLSTTLATNACVEEKGGSAALIFFGGDHRVIRKYGEEYGLPPVDEIYLQDSFTTFSGGFEREPDWDKFRDAARHKFTGLDGVGIIEIYAMKNSAVVERKARDIFKQLYDIPVVCGHELFSELNSLRRGASTLLNARLFPVIQEFLAAIKLAMDERKVTAPVYIVRSDGSLMSDSFAHTRPVETLLCGPAASVMGSVYLSGQKNSIVVDMGGTTTDIALVTGNVPVKAVGGVQVGKWKTFVSGLYIKTFGLGGDSAVHYIGNDLILEDYRVVPFCVAAEQCSTIVQNLEKLLADGKKHLKYLHEHYMLVKNIESNPRYSDDEKTLCRTLEANGPMSMREAAECVPGGDVFKFNATRLIKEGIIQVIGLTPTDIMHIKGDFNKFPAEASLLGASYVARHLDVSVDDLCNRVYNEVKRKMYVNIIKALLENKESHYSRDGIGMDVERLINECYKMASLHRVAGCNVVSGCQDSFPDIISATFTTDYVLTGVGAPIHIFLHDVAALLGTTAVIPKHYDVANALGAIAGSISAVYTVDIRPNYGVAGITGYTVSGLDETLIFKSIREAEAFAVEEASAGVREEAVRRGAKGEIDVSCSLVVDEANTGNYSVYLGTRAVARAVGAIGLA
ncbi:MAG: hypothetical protein FWH01_00770 [Oscillospiraceae bacterium]|nr:hypothetical protein [Oscillospiraceae bacterium]